MKIILIMIFFIITSTLNTVPVQMNVQQMNDSMQEMKMEKNESCHNLETEDSVCITECSSSMDSECSKSCKTDCFNSFNSFSVISNIHNQIKILLTNTISIFYSNEYNFKDLKNLFRPPIA